MRRAVFSYDPTYPSEALPVIEVEFRKQVTTPGLVVDRVVPDTGADASALPWSDGERLALDPRDGAPGLIGGATAVSTVIFAVWARLDGQEYQCRPQADVVGHERILGRDGLNRMDLVFCGPAQEIVINP